MKQTQTYLPRTSGFASAWQRWRERASGGPSLDGLPCIPVAAKQVQALSSPKAFREALLAQIARARQRILMATLYLQDDEAGREVLSALYAAKKAQPQLEMAAFVDWPREQRGLIGKTRSAGNAAMYKDMARRLGPGIAIYGVPVQRREFMGVMHLKGFVIDDCILYSGASLNDVYLHRQQRYRLDRYHLIHNRALADSMADLLTGILRGNPAVHPLDFGKAPKTVALLGAIVTLRRLLAKTLYHFAQGKLKQG